MYTQEEEAKKMRARDQKDKKKCFYQGDRLNVVITWSTGFQIAEIHLVT